jgi:DNA invertase Pin-like site-specific DNA recombinase
MLLELKGPPAPRRGAHRDSTSLTTCYTFYQEKVYTAMHTATAYYRTSSAANVGEDKDSQKRQRSAVEAYAERAGYTIVDSYYDAAVSGADALDARPGFADALKRIASNGVRTIIVETASRFARDLIVAETGFRRRRDAGITLIAADAPNSFLDDTPTSSFIRQVLAAVQELDKAMIVSKLKGGARQRKRATGVKVEGRKNYAQAVPATVERAKTLKGEGLTLRQVGRSAGVGRLPYTGWGAVSVHGSRAHDFRKDSVTVSGHRHAEACGRPVAS